jgi:hypothetical protein
VEYTAEAKGYGNAKAAVSLSPSSLLLVGPLRAPKFVTTPRSDPSRIYVYAGRLDASLDMPEVQMVAGGHPVPIELISSNPAAGKFTESPLTLPAGAGSVMLYFQPTAEGEAELTLKQPEGFSKPPTFEKLAASVRRPGIGLSDQLFVGENLEVAGVLSLAVLSPQGGTKVTITSEDPQKLILSNSPTEKGSASIVVTVPENESSARYYIQALGKSGTVDYTARAAGFRERTATVTLAPSGVIITPASQGPPDEAHVLRKEAPDAVHRMSVRLKDSDGGKLVAWTAQLDPITHRSADITVQPLRGGMTIDVLLQNANPGVGTVNQKLTIPSGSDHAIADFKPLQVGTTEINVVTPAEFTKSANATTVIAYVKE